MSSGWRANANAEAGNGRSQRWLRCLEPEEDVEQLVAELG